MGYADNGGYFFFPRLARVSRPRASSRNTMMSLQYHLSSLLPVFASAMISMLPFAVSASLSLT